MNRTEEQPVPLGFLTDPRALVDGLRLGGAGVWRWKIDSDQLEWTRNLESVHGLPPGSFDGTLSSFQLDLHPDDADAVWQRIRESIVTGTPFLTVYRAAPRPGRDDLWIETSGGLAIGRDGSQYLTGICLEVSERIRNERQLQRRLAQQKAIARFGSFALSEGDLAKVLDDAVAIAAEVLDVPLSKILQFSDTADQLVLRAGIGWVDAQVGHTVVGIEKASQAGFTLLVDQPVIVRDLLTETRFNGPALLHDHGVRSGISVVIPGSRARPFGVFGIHATDLRNFDQTDAEFLQSLANVVAGAARHAAAADHQTLLVREMAHRAGNMLQLVNSIATQTFHPDVDTSAAKHAFSERLSALARSNYVVARGGWTSTSFTELVGETLKPFGQRVKRLGRDILLPPELCFDMGLVLHELATNSVKYGSLGRDGGTVAVEWSFEPSSSELRAFRLEWNDSDLAPPAEFEVKTGFGSKLIRALVERKWNGVVRVAKDANFRISFEIPLAARLGSDSAGGGQRGLVR